MIDAGSVLLGVIASFFVWMVVTTHYWPKRSKRSDVDIEATAYARGRKEGERYGSTIGAANADIWNARVWEAHNAAFHTEKSDVF